MAQKATFGFMLLNTEKNASATTVQIKLPNANPTWRFFFETRYTCNGVDTAKSNVLFLDINPPAVNPIDSVSIDLVTQLPIMRLAKKRLLGYQRLSYLYKIQRNK